MNHKRLYISYIFRYIVIGLVLLLSLRYILPYKLEYKKMITIIFINLIVSLILDKYNQYIKEIKYIDDNKKDSNENISYRLLDN